MSMEKIIKVLKAKQKALQKQSDELPDFANDEDELVWSAEVSAKLELVNELLEKFDKKPKKKQ